MFRNIKNYFNKKNLKDKKYLYLFEDSQIKDEYVCFDCETTGLNPKKDDIISIGAVIIKD
ncbi:3'-5' exonuclease, partial [Aliarcobacter butzleri]|nr:3'-5' exonuclease [Aliarcobacter butzleri]